MKTKQIPLPQKTGYQVVEEKLSAANAYLKTIDINQLHETVEQASEKQQRKYNV